MITKASRYMTVLTLFLYYVITAQYNKQILCYEIQPTNEFVVFAFIGNTVVYVCYHFFLRWFINKFMYDTLVFVFSICINTVIILLNNCPMHGEFPSDAWLKMNAREKTIFKGEINVFSTKIFEKLWFEFSLNILKLK